MTNPFLLSDDVLNDVMEALYYGVSRVTADEMRTTPVADDWNKVQRWLADARTALEEETQGHRASMSVPAFPINGPRLRSLQAEVNAVVAQREGLPVAPRVNSLSEHEPLHLRLVQNLRHINRAWVAVVGLSIVSLLLLVTTLLTQAQLHAYAIVANFAVTGMAIGVGARNYFHLWHHRHLLHALQPFLKHSVADQ